MATSVYDWMLGQKRATPPRDEEIVSSNEDILVRLLKSLDAKDYKAPVAST